MPLCSMTTRPSIGCSSEAGVTPGKVATALISSQISFAVIPSRQTASGLSITYVSIMAAGAGSSADSARPILPSTFSTSGMSRMSVSCVCRISIACEKLAAGKSVGM